MQMSYIGTDVYIAILERGQQGLPLFPGDLVNAQTLAQDRFAMFAENPGGAIHPASEHLGAIIDYPEWPSLMLRGTFVDSHLIRIIDELPDWAVFGPHGKAIEDLIDQYLFLDDEGKDSFHAVEQTGRQVLADYSRTRHETGFIESIFDGTVFDGQYAMACRALYFLANSSCVTGPLALVACIILRDSLGEGTYDQLVEPYRVANIPFADPRDESTGH